MRWSEQRKALMRELWFGSLPTRVIAAQLGVKPMSLYERAKQDGGRAKWPLRKWAERSPPCRRHDTVWSSARIDCLRQLWQRGEPTAAIAEVLAVSSNAVIGKAHRLKLSPRMRYPRKVNRDAVLPVLRVNSKRAAVVMPRSAPAAVIGSAGIAKLEGCRWPVGDSAQAEDYYCNAQRVAAPRCDSYCQYHYRMAYRPVSPSATRSRSRLWS